MNNMSGEFAAFDPNKDFADSIQIIREIGAQQPFRAFSILRGFYDRVSLQNRLAVVAEVKELANTMDNQAAVVEMVRDPARVKQRATEIQAASLFRSWAVICATEISRDSLKQAAARKNYPQNIIG